MEIVVVSLVVLLLIGALIWRAANRPQSLSERFKQWAHANGVVVRRAERRLLFAGPFFWKRAGIVYKIEVQTSQGKARTGWIRFGYDFFSSRAWSEEVIWDDAHTEAA